MVKIFVFDCHGIMGSWVDFMYKYILVSQALGLYPESMHHLHIFTSDHLHRTSINRDIFFFFLRRLHN